MIFEAARASKPIIQLAGEEQGALEWTSEEAKQLYRKHVIGGLTIERRWDKQRDLRSR